MALRAVPSEPVPPKRSEPSSSWTGVPSGRSYTGHQTLNPQLCLFLIPWIYTVNSPAAEETQPGRFWKCVGVARSTINADLCQARRETQSCRGAWTSLSGHAWGGALTSSCTVACHTPSASSTLTVYNQPHHSAPPLATPTHPCVLSFPWDPFTSLDGFLSTSPTPPPLRSPWLRTVTMHMSSVSHVCSLSCSVSSAGSSSVNRASHNMVKTGGGKRYRDSTATFL